MEMKCPLSSEEVTTGYCLLFTASSTSSGHVDKGFSMCKEVAYFPAPHASSPKRQSDVLKFFMSSECAHVGKIVHTLLFMLEL